MSPENEIEQRVHAIVRELRNSRDIEANWRELTRWVEGDLDAIVRRCSIRWLISICDSYADFAAPAQAARALSVSMFVNMLRMAETVKYVRPDVDPTLREKCRHEIIPLYEGLFLVCLDWQDVYLNLARRMSVQLADDRVIGSIWREVLTRLHATDNVLTELARGSPVAERYFPVNPAGMTDNYGLSGVKRAPCPRSQQ